MKHHATPTQNDSYFLPFSKEVILYSLLPPRPLKNQYIKKKESTMNVTILPVRRLGQYTENERVHLGNNYYLMSTQASCSVLRALHTLFHSMLTLTFCDRHYIFTEVTESEKDQITKAVNGRPRICHRAFMDPNVCSLSTMPKMANYYT